MQYCCTFCIFSLEKKYCNIADLLGNTNITFNSTKKNFRIDSLQYYYF